MMMILLSEIFSVHQVSMLQLYALSVHVSEYVPGFFLYMLLYLFN